MRLMRRPVVLAIAAGRPANAERCYSRMTVRIIANVAVVVLVGVVIAGCQAPPSPTPATPTTATPSPDGGPGAATPPLPTPGTSAKLFPSPTIEIPPPID